MQIKLLVLNLLLFFSNSSLNVLPETYAIYPGISGNTQGDKKLIMPALNANTYSNISN